MKDVDKIEKQSKNISSVFNIAIFVNAQLSNKNCLKTFPKINHLSFMLNIKNKLSDLESIASLEIGAKDQFD